MARGSFSFLDPGPWSAILIDMLRTTIILDPTVKSKAVTLAKRACISLSEYVLMEQAGTTKAFYLDWHFRLGGCHVYPTC